MVTICASGAARQQAGRQLAPLNAAARMDADRLRDPGDYANFAQPVSWPETTAATPAP